MKQWIDRKFLNPIKYITAPFDCSEQIKYKKAGAIWQIFCQLALVFIARILTLVLNGFLFNTAKIENVNLLLEAVIITALYACFIVSNWAFCALTEGEATFIEISLVTGFSLTPYIIASFINTVLTNLLVLREQAFIEIISTIGIIWSVLLLMIGMKEVHRFTMKKTVFSLVVCIVFMALIAFLCVIVFSMTQQFLIFIMNIYNEIVFRM